MITKIGNKDAFNPITTDGKTAVVMWAYQPILDKDGNETLKGSWKVEVFKTMPTLERVKDMILSYYNSKIDEKILSGMEWNGMKVWLSSENQFNYKAAYDIAVQTNGGNLPVVFKFVISVSLKPKITQLSLPTSSLISTLAPSNVPKVIAPLIMNFILPVPEASFPAVEICSEISAAGIMISAFDTS